MRLVTKFEDGSFELKEIKKVMVWRAEDEKPKRIKKHQKKDTAYLIQVDDDEVISITKRPHIIIDDMMVDTFYHNLVVMGMYGHEAFKDASDRANSRYTNTLEDKKEEKPVNEDPEA